MIRKITFDRK